MTEPEVRTEVVHRCPPEGSGVTPCCGRTPFELPYYDRLTLRSSLVTCSAEPPKGTVKP